MTERKTVQLPEDDIKIVEVRIRNFRSLVQVDVTLDYTTVLIGENNAGKTSFLEALHAAIGSGRRIISEEDIFIGPDEKKAPKARAVTIDVLIRPVGSDGGVRPIFPEGSYWVALWGNGIAQDEKENDFVAMRTQMKWSGVKGEYETDRRFLLDWPDPADWERARINEAVGRVALNQIEPIGLYVMDAKRDIDDELQNRGSFWHRLISNPGLADMQVASIEQALSGINDEIIKSSEVLTHVQKHLNEIYRTVPCDKGSVAVTPLTRHVRDLSKGMDISFTTRGAQSFPLTRHGMGTRCVAALLLFQAYSVWRQQKRGRDRAHSILALEEPEAHLHPQAQRALFLHIEKTPGQRVISTHSPYIAAQADISQFRHFHRDGANTEISRIDTTKLEQEEKRKIQRAVLHTRGDLLYAQALVLCSGETEEQALPVFAEEYFGRAPDSFGMTFIGVGGDGNYRPFLLLAAGLKIRWYICSDGETTAIGDIRKALQGIGATEMSPKDVFVLPNGCNYETYLVDEGYGDVIETTLNSYYESKDYVSSYITRMSSQKGSGGTARDYTGAEGRRRAILEILSDNKTKLAVPLARKMVELKDPERRIPEKLKQLFAQMKGDLAVQTVRGGI